MRKAVADDLVPESGQAAATFSILARSTHTTRPELTHVEVFSWACRTGNKILALSRACLGELVQIDGCDHRWFEDRAKPCVLLVFIDNATGQLVAKHFCNAESTFEYMNVTKRYLLDDGKPVAFYSDKHAVFRVNKAVATRGEGVTQFGRALHDLNIESICANSPAAKGRVERANGTLQDRLVKEPRLAPTLIRSPGST